MSIKDSVRIRRGKRLTLALRGTTILLLAAGTALCALHQVWYGAALFLVVMNINIYMTYRILKRLKVLEQVSAESAGGARSACPRLLPWRAPATIREFDSG